MKSNIEFMNLLILLFLNFFHLSSARKSILFPTENMAASFFLLPLSFYRAPDEIANNLRTHGLSVSLALFAKLFLTLLSSRTSLAVSQQVDLLNIVIFPQCQLVIEELALWMKGFSFLACFPAPSFGKTCAHQNVSDRRKKKEKYISSFFLFTSFRRDLRCSPVS